MSKPIAKQIKDRRKAVGMTQGELAKACGTKQSRISQVEDDRYDKLSFRSVREIADALDCELEVVLKPRTIKTMRLDCPGCCICMKR